MDSIPKKLYRSNKEKIFLGVFGGIAEYFRIDPSIIRLLFILVGILTAFLPLIVFYIIAWAVMPEPPPNYPHPHLKKFYRSKKDRKIAGVCGGLAEYAGVDSTLIRVALVVVTIATGLVLFIVMYLIAWAIVPEIPSAEDVVIEVTPED